MMLSTFSSAVCYYILFHLQHPIIHIKYGSVDLTWWSVFPNFLSIFIGSFTFLMSFVRTFTYSGCKSSVKCMICTYFLSVSDLSFHSLKSIFRRGKGFNFDVCFLNFILYGSCFWYWINFIFVSPKIIRVFSPSPKCYGKALYLGLWSILSF